MPTTAPRLRFRRSPRHTRLVSTILAAAVLHPSLPTVLRAAAPPRSLNVLLVTADDLNGDSPGWMGGTAIRTPTLDALAAESHRFLNAHVTAPLCQPSRAALMTGRVPHRNGAVGFDPIRDDVPTLVEILRAHGWFTAALNKLEHMQPPAKFPWDVALEGSGKRPAAMRAQVSAVLAAADRAGRPFFVNANLTDPHRPFRRVPDPGRDGPHPHILHLPAFLDDLPAVRAELRSYFASVARLDDGLAAVLDALAASGHTDDTAVVFLSDNGMSFPFAKATVYRSGTWAPTLLRYPDMPPPADHSEMVSSVDLMPTLLELLGVAAPPGLDGRSVIPLVHGETQAARDVVVTHVNTVSSGARFPQRCIRTRTRSLLWQPWADGVARFDAEPIRSAAFRAMRGAAGRDGRIARHVHQLLDGVPLALYDLERDPGERRNVFDLPAYRTDFERLASALLAHMARTGDPELAHFRTAVAVRAAGVR